MNGRRYEYKIKMSTSENIIISEDIKSEPQNNNIIINLDNQKNDSFNKLFSIQNLILKHKMYHLIFYQGHRKDNQSQMILDSHQYFA